MARSGKKTAPRTHSIDDAAKARIIALEMQAAEDHKRIERLKATISNVNGDTSTVKSKSEKKKEERKLKALNDQVAKYANDNKALRSQITLLEADTKALYEKESELTKKLTEAKALASNSEEFLAESERLKETVERLTQEKAVRIHLA